MKRWTLIVATSASLLLILATVVLWVRTDRMGYILTNTNAERTLTLWVVGGSLGVQHTTNPGWWDVAGTQHGWILARPVQVNTSEPGTVRDWHALGFEWFVRKGGAVNVGTGATRMAPPRWRVGVPLWFIAVVPAAAAAYWARCAMRARRANRPGLCRRCGYDLRATPDRCPECGTIVAAKTVEAAA